MCRISVVRLNPHGKVYPHVDEGDYYKVRDRYHLVLRSPGGSSMNSGGEEVVFRDGELWWFNNKAVHDAFNPSAEGRIHVIFDVLPARPVPVLEPDPEADALPTRIALPSSPSAPSSRTADPASDERRRCGTGQAGPGQPTRRLVGRRPCDPRRQDAGGRRAIAPRAGNRRRPGGAPRLGAPCRTRLVEGLGLLGGSLPSPGHLASATGHDRSQRASACFRWVARPASCPSPMTRPGGDWNPTAWRRALRL